MKTIFYASRLYKASKRSIKALDWTPSSVHWPAKNPAEARQPEYDAAQIDKSRDEVILNRARWTKFFARKSIRPLRLSYAQFSLAPVEALNEIAGFADVTIPSDIGQIQARLRIQRDASNLEWRQRFVAEKRSLAFLDPV